MNQFENKQQTEIDAIFPKNVDILFLLFIFMFFMFVCLFIVVFVLFFARR